uniref:Uncharacterized protein n=1 Tax=Oryza meridionalis TaxID=40149 RepID=A0A0E0E1R9_9ORYZ
MAAPSSLTMGPKPKPKPELVVVVEECECAAWTRAMRMTRRGRAGTTAAGDGGRGVIVLAIGYHRCRCHWEIGDKSFGLVWFASAACSPTLLPCPLSLLYRNGCTPVGLDPAGRGSVLRRGAVDRRAVFPVENSLCGSTHRVLVQEEPHWRRSGDGDMMVVVGVAEQRGEEREEDGGKKEEDGKEGDGRKT